MTVENQTQNMTDEQQQQQQEKMLSQSEVNALIGRAKADAQQKARSQAEQEYQQKLQQLQEQKQAAQERGEDTKEIDKDALYQEFQERLSKDLESRQHAALMSQVADNYLSKIEAGKKNYEDFEEVTRDFDPGSFPQIVYLVSGLENASDIIYELSKNPSKLATVDYLAQRSPKKAQQELQRIGKSVEQNRQAEQQEQQSLTDSPLDRLQPTNKTSGSGQMSVSDLRNQPWLRG